MINTPRLRQCFLDLVAINSPPGREEPAREYCLAALRAAGMRVAVDGAGNVIGERRGAADVPWLFFSGHLDTVQPTEGLRVVEEDGTFRTDGRTILGADDKCALAAILEAVAVLNERGAAHAPLRVVLTVGEEVGLIGARALDRSAICGATGYVLDASGPTGSIITAAPSHEILEGTIRGRAAHSGFEPEAGINALQAASRAISEMRLGRIDAETTANIGVLRAGQARNIVPEEVWFSAEARSRDEGKLRAQVEHMLARFRDAAAAVGAVVDITPRRAYTTYAFRPEDPAPDLAARALRRLGHDPKFHPTGGGSDASVFNEWGVPTVVLSCGYHHAHSVHEYVTLADMELAAAWCVSIAELAAAEQRDG
jgi:tripeptide aminopeptidase